MPADYEEHVVMTGVKSLQHCCVCRVHPDERENLCPDQPWGPRTHHWTQRQIRRQETSEGRRKYPNGHPDRVHPLRNFAWRHRFVNIHQTITPDNLHMLDKGVVKHFESLTRACLGAIVKAARGKKIGRRHLLQANSIRQLDQRFRVVPAFTALKHFNHYSQITQWTGAEFKSLSRQLVPAVAPLLTKKSPGAIQCLRAVLEFVMLARCPSHTEETLGYLGHARFRVNLTKEAFREHRSTKNFNFPKFHSMTHYVAFIRSHGSALGFDTAISEAEHIEQIKNFYNRTNKRLGYEEQILMHNVRDLRMKVMTDARRHARGHAATKVDYDTRTQVNRVSRAKHHGPEGLNWLKSEEEERDIRRSGRVPNYWCYASTVACEAKLPDLLDALAVFVREIRKKGTMEETAPTRRELDPSWVAQYLVMLHPSIVTWKKTGKDSKDLGRLAEETLYCAPNWQRQEQRWRNDFVWIQEHTIESKTRLNRQYPQGGRLVGQLLVTLTVINKERRDGRGFHRKYTGSMIATQRFRNGGAYHNIHGMLEVEPWPQSISQNPRTLVGRRFYELTNIIRSAHVVPGDNKYPRISYVNNYIDFDQFNTLYDPDFENKGTRAALAVEKTYR